MSEHIEERSYIAFISYRHKSLDREAAIALQKKIEHFKIPKELRDESGSDRLGYCFRDEDELPTSSSLSDSIRYALDHTQFLIVICTPDLPKSEWCAEEIRYFLSSHDRDHLLAVLVNGEPDESFSPYMTTVYNEKGEPVRNVEPLAANITGTPEHFSRQKFKKESIRIIAALIGCPFDELWQRERRYQNRRKLIFGGAAFAAMAVFAIVVGTKNLQIQAKNEEITAQNAQIIEQNGEITRQNSEITEKNRELQIREGKLLKDAGDLLLEGHDLSGAADNAEAALQIEDVHTDGAELLLTNALGAYSAEALRLDLAVEQDTAVDRCTALSDSSILFTSDRYGMVRAFSEGSEIWSFSAVPSKNREEYLNDSRSTELILAENESVLLVGNAYYTAGLSPKTGELLWDVKKQYYVNFLEVSPDGTLFALINDFAQDCVSVRSAKTGKTLFWFYLPAYHFNYAGIEMDYPYTFTDYTLGKSFGGCFSADGSYLLFGAQLDLSLYESLLNNEDPAGTLDELWNTEEEINEILNNNEGKADESSESASDERGERMIYFLVDIKDQSIKTVGEEPIHTGMNPIFGLYYNDKTEDLFFVRHDDLDRSTFAGLIDKDGNIEYTLQRPDIRLYNSSVPWSYREGNQKVIAASANNLYVFDKVTGTFTSRYELDRNILSCEWIDRDNDVLMAVLDDGTYNVYPLNLNENTQYLSTGEKFHINDLTYAACTSSGIFRWDAENSRLTSADGSWLLLSSDSPQKITAAEIFTDPNALELSDAVFTRSCYGFHSVDGSEFYLLKREGDDSILTVLDPASGSILSQTTYKNLSYLPGRIPGILPGGKGILYNNCLFREDGSAGYLQGTDAMDYSSFNSNAVTAQAEDGTVYSAYMLSSEKNKEFFFFWENETGLYTYYNDEGELFLLGEEGPTIGKPGENALLKAGINGAVIAGAREASDRQYTRYIAAFPDAAFHLDAVDSAMPWSLLCSGKKSRLFAVLENDGVLRIYDPEKGTAQTEIKDSGLFTGAVALDFAGENDQYLGVLSYNGEFSLYDTANGTLLVKDTNNALATTYGTNEMELFLSADQSRLVCMVTESQWRDKSCGAVYDLVSAERVADIDNLAAYSSVSDRVLVFKTDAKLMKYYLCPLYSTQMLFEWPE